MKRTILLIACSAFCAMQVLQAQTFQEPEVLSTPAFTPPPIPPAAPSTNKPPSPVRVWERHPDAVVPPGAHSVTTNADGTPMHHFNLHPVVTNMTALTNSVVQMQERRRALDKELKESMERETALKIAITADYKLLTGIATNFVPKDAEGKKIKERMDALIIELKGLQDEYRKRLEADPAFKAAKERVDGEQAEFKVLQDRKAKIREEMGSAGADLWQINRLKQEKLKEEKNKTDVPAPVAEPKAAEPKAAEPKAAAP